MYDPEVVTLLKSINNRLGQLVYLTIKGDLIMDADIQKLIDQAKANTNIEASAVTAIKALADKLAAAIANTTGLSEVDRAILQQEVIDMQTSAAAIGAAVATTNPTP